MRRHFFIGLFLVGFQLACYNCVPGRALSLRDLSMELPLKEKHTADNLNFLEDAKVEMAKRVAECKDERNCSWIEMELAKYGGSLKEYCELYKDTAPIKQCRKTCKTCKAPAPIECKDERDCSWIKTELAKYGGSLKEYCELYKDRAPIKQCRKTCEKCKAPAPIECKDERDCSWIKTELAKYGGSLKEYCELYKDRAPIKQCRKTCEKCPKTPSTPSRDLGVATALANKRLAEAARDSRANLLYKVKKILAARRGYPRAFPRKRAFSGLHGKAVLLVTVTKNTADVMMNFKVFALFISVSVTSLGRNSAVPFSSLRDEASAGCKDERPDCDYIVKSTGGGEKLHQYCKKWKDDAAVKQCRRTCHMCKAPSPTECKDERSDCNWIVQNTGGGEKLEQYCRHYKDVAKQCRKTCNMCSKPPSPPSTEPETMAPETERPTTPTTKPKPTQTSHGGPNECKDERPDCNWIVQNTGGGEKLEQYCRHYKDVAKQCRKTFNMCSKPPSPPSTEPETMAPETERPTTPTTKPKPTQTSHGGPNECKDERPDCNWIVQNTGGGEKLEQYCRHYKDVAKQCRKTFNMCSKPPSPPSTEPETMAPETERPTTPTTKPKPTQTSHGGPNECKDERPDCNWIVQNTGGGEKLEQYCRHYKDLITFSLHDDLVGSKPPSPPSTEPETMAPETERPTTPTTKPKPTQTSHGGPNECKDERPDCNWIVQNTGGGEKLEQYCRHYKDVAKQCRKTFNMCSKPPSPPSTEPETMAPETERPTQKPTTPTQRPTTPTTKPKPTQSFHGGPTGFQRACLEAHNDHRFFHRSPPLKWSAELTRDAQDWANYLAATNLFEHDPTARPKDQGENLYYITPYPKRLCDLGETGQDCLSCGEIVKAWYDEELDYDYVTGRAKVPFAPILHFTQIVWKASKKLGMATAVASDRLVAVARYEPAGNIGGQFQENVLVPDFP
ncbi:uncharacterized protein LOC110065876 [Orbicella faveolata]|uniref:uncharacterized protein LOC110065876 n=1 Tax=Orbicella faveolata TaxID=48498 RepID=UPI0009E32374|nr:uncharacterized protein LOC110065876 [Orbicella faveolata]